MAISKSLASQSVLPRGAILLCAALGILTSNIDFAAAALVGTSCPNASLSLSKTSYAPGDAVQLTGSNPTGTWSLCLYGGDGKRLGLTVNGTDSTLSATLPATATGSVTGIIRLNGSCSTELATAGNCRVAATITTGSGSTTETPTADAPDPSVADPDCDTNGWKYCNPLRGTIENLMEAGTKTVQSLLGLIGTIALLFLVIAGATYMTAAGDEEKIKNAKRIITGAVIGLGIALVSFSLLQAILEMLNGA